MTKPQRVGVSTLRNEQTATFWHWAESEKERAPASVVPLIDREARQIESSYDEGAAIAAWAKDTIGWEPAHPKPLRFFDTETLETIEPPE